MAFRPPLMSPGQANNFYSYMSIGTGLMWLAGGVAAGPAALALGLCGMGAVANNRQESGRCGWLPQMIFQPQPPDPPGPLSSPHWEREVYAAVAEWEEYLKREFGINAVYCYRQMVLDGYKITDAFEILLSLLIPLRERGFWDKGQIQSGKLTPKQLLDQVSGRRVASLELQEWFGPRFFPELYQQFLDYESHPSVQQRRLIDMSMMVYILGLTPISDKPVRRIKWWADEWWENEQQDGNPLYYVADWDWFVGATVHALRDRWEWIIHRMIRPRGMPQHLVDETNDLWNYRVEEHRGDAPPGHPGGVLLSNILFGRTKSYPATEEDMLGMP